MLYTEVLGSGPDLVLLHGWGMHGGVFRSLAERLAKRYRVTVPDLPGHGRSDAIADPSLDGIVAALTEHLPAGAHWVGWSLGALLALRAVGNPGTRARTLSLIAGTPKFVTATDWPGMDEGLLVQFASEFDNDGRQTLRRFLGIQVFGLDDARRQLVDLQARLSERGPPVVSALRAGLGILQHTDLRDELGALQIPALAILGRRDRLVPVEAGAAMRRIKRDLEVRVIDHASHSPFWTHTEETLGGLGCLLGNQPRSLLSF